MSLLPVPESALSGSVLFLTQGRAGRTGFTSRFLADLFSRRVGLCYRVVVVGMSTGIGMHVVDGGEAILAERAAKVTAIGIDLAIGTVITAVAVEAVAEAVVVVVAVAVVAVAVVVGVDAHVALDVDVDIARGDMAKVGVTVAVSHVHVVVVVVRVGIVVVAVVGVGVHGCGGVG